MWYFQNWQILLILGFYMFMFKVHRNVVFKILEIVEKLKTDVDRLHLVSKMKKSSISQNILEIFFPLSKSKAVYRCPFLSLLTFLKF